MLLKIYLDQNIWIDLAKVKYQKEKDPKKVEAYNLIKEKIEKGEIETYLSLCHLHETRKIKNIERRKNLVNLMIELSKGSTILPYPYVIKHEIRNEIFRRLGKKKIDLTSLVFRKGIAHLLGSNLVLKSKSNDSRKLDPIAEYLVLNIANSKEVLKTVMMGEGIFKDIPMVSDSDMVAELERNRGRLFDSFSDKELRKKFTLVDNFSVMIVKGILEILKEYKLTENEIIMFFDNEFNLYDSNIEEKLKEEIYIFIKNVPTFYTTTCLSDSRDANIHRQIHEHDLYDIWGLSIAIPYCDIVICEKMFGTLAKQNKLGQLYNTIILSDIVQILTYLK